MATPYTTVLSTITVVDNTGALISNLSSVSLTVTYPDGTSGAALTLGAGITNLGSGQYQAQYNTKGVGMVVENWSLVDATGNIASLRFEYGVGY